LQLEKAGETENSYAPIVETVEREILIAIHTGSEVSGRVLRRNH